MGDGGGAIDCVICGSSYKSTAGAEKKGKNSKDWIIDMAANINDAQVQKAFEMMRNAGPRGRELAGVLDARGTRVRISGTLLGGFTLNFLNLILLQPPDVNAGDAAFRAWVTILAHEACHVEQGFWVDSIQQELRAYVTQCQVALELGVTLAVLPDVFGKIDPNSAEQQEIGQRAMLTLFAGQSAALVYAALPLAQPERWRAILPAFGEILAVVRAALWKPAQ
jgi:hypothetical protein